MKNKSWNLFQVSSRREKLINKVSYFSFAVYKAYQKDNFYGIKKFVDSSSIERRTAGIDHWLLPFTGYDFTRYDNHTVRLLRNTAKKIFIWNLSRTMSALKMVQAPQNGVSDNFRTRSFCINQWKRLLNLNNFNWPHEKVRYMVNVNIVCAAVK